MYIDACVFNYMCAYLIVLKLDSIPVIIEGISSKWYHLFHLLKRSTLLEKFGIIDFLVSGNYGTHTRSVCTQVYLLECTTITSHV